MKALSLWQPWATLMASGAKRVETRSWPPHGLKPGELVAIHAAKHWTRAEREIINEDIFFKRFLTTASRCGLWDFDYPPLGCMVAIARFHHYEETRTLVGRVTEREHTFGNYGPFRFGWVFSEVRPLQPIPAPGRQGIFNWQPPTDVVYLGPRNSIIKDPSMGAHLVMLQITSALANYSQKVVK